MKNTEGGGPTGGRNRQDSSAAFFFGVVDGFADGGDVNDGAVAVLHLVPADGRAVSCFHPLISLFSCP